jgi:hypothetical protein
MTPLHNLLRCLMLAWFFYCLFMWTHHANAQEHVHGENGIPDWYDAKCCSNRDCHPVPDGFVSNTEQGVEVKGHGLLSYTDPRLNWSRDLRDHICESQTYYNGVKQPGKLLCVYRKFLGG